MTAVAMEVESPPAPHPVKKYIQKRCQHDRKRSWCKDCGGAEICQHDWIRWQCKDCGGASICQHDKRRSQCKDCGGASICQHDKQRSQCAECQNLPCTIEGCPQFGHKFCDTKSLRDHMRSKHSGEPKALTKTKELDVHKAMQAAGIDFGYQTHIPFRGCGLGSETICAYLDFDITTHWGVIIPEVDEHEHANYPAMCDVRRDFDIYASIAMGSRQKVVILRYNPDEFRIDNKTVKVPAKERQRRLVEVLRAWIAEDMRPPHMAKITRLRRAWPRSHTATAAPSTKRRPEGRMRIECRRRIQGGALISATPPLAPPLPPTPRLASAPAPSRFTSRRSAPHRGLGAAPDHHRVWLGGPLPSAGACACPV